MIANEIRSKIIKKVKEAKYFSIILDRTFNISNQEQMTLVLRCVDISTSPRISFLPKCYTIIYTFQHCY